MSDITLAGNPGNLWGQKVTIPAGAAQSEMITTAGLALVGVVMPDAWDPADLGYKAGYDSDPNNLQIAYSAAGAAYTTAVDASRFVAFPIADAIFAPNLQITSVVAGGQSTTPANQTVAREIILVFRRLFS